MARRPRYFIDQPDGDEHRRSADRSADSDELIEPADLEHAARTILTRQSAYALHQNDSQARSPAPEAYLWARQLQQANLSQGLDQPWREISIRSRQRGAPELAGREWPGSVYFPSSISTLLIRKSSVAIPSAWGGFSPADQARLVSLLAAWRLERGVYEFNGLAQMIVANSEVQAPLTPRLFNGMPSQAIYVDLTAIRREEDSLPNGFLVGLNCIDVVQPSSLAPGDRRSTQRMTELAFVTFHEREGTDFLSVELNGQTPDALVAKAIAHWRDSHGRDAPIGDLMTRYEKNLQVMLAAVLMVCVNRPRMERVQDVDAFALGSSSGGFNVIDTIEDGHPFVTEDPFEPVEAPPSITRPWNRWRIHDAFDGAISNEYEQVKDRLTGGSPSLLACWSAKDNQSSITLRCTMGCGVDLKTIARGSVPLITDERTNARAEQRPSPGDGRAGDALDGEPGPIAKP